MNVLQVNKSQICIVLVIEQKKKNAYYITFVDQQSIWKAGNDRNLSKAVIARKKLFHTNVTEAEW